MSMNRGYFENINDYTAAFVPDARHDVVAAGFRFTVDESVFHCPDVFRCF